MDTSVPVRYRRTCTYCGSQVDSRHAHTYVMAHGWKRIGNNGNSITLAKLSDEWSCGDCIDKLRHGIPVGQLSIFEAAEYDREL